MTTNGVSSLTSMVGSFLEVDEPATVADVEVDAVGVCASPKMAPSITER